MEVQPRLLEDDEPWPAYRCRLQDLGQQLLVPNQAFSVWTLTSPCLCVGFQGPVKATVGFWLASAETMCHKSLMMMMMTLHLAKVAPPLPAALWKTGIFKKACSA